MADKLYALLVGINDYPPGVNPLTGCVNDVEALAGLLRDMFTGKDADRLQLHTSR